MDSAALSFADGSFDRALLFFLLHEQPQAVREKTLAEALRVVRPGGTLTIVDYAPPSRQSPALFLEAGSRPARAVCPRPLQRGNRHLAAAGWELRFHGQQAAFLWWPVSDVDAQDDRDTERSA
jgi:SAM-dependent methyltransferase